MYFSLYNSKESFDKKQAFRVKKYPVTEGNASVQFKNISKGTYAVICFYDTNDNQQLDFDGFIPSESFGCSNNPQLYAPPTFEQLQFEVTKENQSLLIALQ